MLIQIESRASNRISRIDELRRFAEKWYDNLNLYTKKHMRTKERMKERNRTIRLHERAQSIDCHSLAEMNCGCLFRALAVLKEYTSSGTVKMVPYLYTVHTNAELSIVRMELYVFRVCELRSSGKKKKSHSVILATNDDS